MQRCKELMDLARVRGRPVIVLADKGSGRERTYWQNQSGIARRGAQQLEEEERLVEDGEAVRARVMMYNVRLFEDCSDGEKIWLPANICEPAAEDAR
jgi:hypothetical protein